jgi:hypothetical protein
MKTESIQKILGTIIRIGLIVTAVIKVAQFGLKTMQTFSSTIDVEAEEITKEDE